MKLAEIVAFIGAAAWLPQIASWIYKKYSKPIIKLIPSSKLELGYTAFGPIINLTSSISSQKKDALIDRITLKVTHEKGDTRLLTWKFLNEIQQQIRSHTGETAEILKNQPAIALKVPTISLAEKIIGFQDLDFQEKFKIKTDKVIETYNFLKAKNINADAKKELTASKEYKDLLDFFKNSMYWQEGNYLIEITIKEVTVKTPFIEKFKFLLSKIDIESLSHNKTAFEKDLQILINLPLEKEQKIEPATWNWINPTIETIEHQE
jgi:hypothetical protein